MQQKQNGVSMTRETIITAASQIALKSQEKESFKGKQARESAWEMSREHFHICGRWGRVQKSGSH